MMAAAEGHEIIVNSFLESVSQHLTFTSYPFFSFLDYLSERRGQKEGFHPGFESGTSHTMGTVHLKHATQVSLPRQLLMICAQVRPPPMK